MFDDIISSLNYHKSSFSYVRCVKVCDVLVTFSYII